MPAAEPLVVALLAAGASTRFGAADKLGAVLGDRPLVAWAARAGRSIHAAQHLVVTGPDLAQHASLAGYRRLINGQADEGLSSSLRLAARHAREAGAAALLVLLGDMPLVTTAHLQALLAAFARTGGPVFTRAARGAAQPPALFPAGMFSALEGLSGDGGARRLAQGASAVEAPADMLLDVDVPDDLDRCRIALGIA